VSDADRSPPLVAPRRSRGAAPRHLVRFRAELRARRLVRFVPSGNASTTGGRIVLEAAP